MDSNIKDLQEIRQLLGWAAIGTMIRHELVEKSQITMSALRQSNEIDEVAIVEMSRAVSALARGFLPQESICRAAQREAAQLIQAVRESSRLTEYERAR